MKRGDKSLAVRAKQYISICCETLCERAVVEEYIQELESEIDDLKQRLSKCETLIERGIEYNEHSV